jgi:ElaB/YqjD/DUF883 family membrane-anchored ribosome-binding protein
MVEQVSNPAMSSAAEKMKEGAVEFKEAFADTASETWQQYCQQTENMIRENPYRSLAVAFGLGALLGVLLFRRS